MMKLSIAALAATSSLAAARPHVVRDELLNDFQNDMADAIIGNGTCQDVAVIFARGTFDSGNLGVWVGPQFFQSIKDNVQNVALQGVDPSRYPADLHGYLSEEGGSVAGGQAMADQIEEYVEKCDPKQVFVTGWSQGAIVAHKALQTLEEKNSKSLDKLAGVVTFGDPNKVWNQIPLPSGVPEANFESPCVSDPLADPLCAGWEDTFHKPTMESIIQNIKDLAAVADTQSSQQMKDAAAYLISSFPGQLKQAWDGFTAQLPPRNFIRLMLTPQHFTYGFNGMAKEAGEWVGQQVNGA